MVVLCTRCSNLVTVAGPHGFCTRFPFHGQLDAGRTVRHFIVVLSTEGVNTDDYHWDCSLQSMINDWSEAHLMLR